MRVNGRGKDKRIESSDFPNMSPQEQAAVTVIIANRGITPKVRIEGTAVVRRADTGNARYEDKSMQGNYNEERVT